VIRLAVIIGLILAAPAFAAAADRNEIFQQLMRHPARRPATWSEWAAKPAAQRVAPAPPVLLDYLHKDNENQGWAERPTTAGVDPAFYIDVAAALSGMPEIVKRHFEAHAIGVFLVRDLGGTAYGEMLVEDAKVRRGLIVLDVGSLDRVANAWATWRERSPFSDSESIQIEATIERDADDTRAQAIQYILLHEIAHLVGAAQRQHPDWNDKNADPANYPFSRLSWRMDGKAPASRHDSAFPLSAKVGYYKFKAASLKSEDIERVYRQFGQSGFVSLYAATNMFDDFAETYAMYVHVVLQRRPWQLRIRQGDRVVMQIDRPILDERCKQKLEYFEKFFGRDTPGGRQ
jgi:hypothetical protein